MSGSKDMSKEEPAAARLELTTHCPKCRNVIGKDTKVCTNCGVEVASVASVDRPVGGVLGDSGAAEAHAEGALIEEVRDMSRSLIMAVLVSDGSCHEHALTLAQLGAYVRSPEYVVLFAAIPMVWRRADWEELRQQGDDLRVRTSEETESPFRKHMGTHKGIGDVDAYIEEMRGR